MSVKSDAIGLDNVSFKFIKLIFPVIGKYITCIFNTILTTSKFPDCWKAAKIIPINKIKIPSSGDDFRPISILSALSKAFEIILQQQMQTYLNEANLLSKFQSAYRQGYCTSTATLNIVDDIRRQLDKGKISIISLLDFSKAFDTVNPSILINKLSLLFQFDETACKLIKSYLTNRSQKVIIDECSSTLLMKFIGVPQGSIIGPLLFALYINDVGEVIDNCKYHLYADDLQLYISDTLRNCNGCVENVNSDIRNIVKWAESNCLKLNAKKTQCMVVSNKPIDIASFPNISVTDNPIPYAKSVKNLGLIMNNNLEWEDHVSLIRKRVNFLLRQLWCTTNFAATELRLKFFKTYILPHFTYCATTFFGMLEKEFRKLELLHNSCVRYVFKIRKFDHISPFSKLLLGCSLRDYYEFLVCSSIFKVVSTGEPVYLAEKFIHLRSNRCNNLLVSKNKLKKFNKSYFICGVTLWNSLPSSIKASKSLNVFRREYKQHYNLTI